MTDYDIAIVGAGMAGASLAAELAPNCRVLLLEAEDRPGYHSTGRSAAFWMESYGGPDIQPLTSASGPLLRAGGFLKPRGALYVGRAEDREKLDRFEETFARDVVLERRDANALRTMIPGLNPIWESGLFEPSCVDIDVAALHQSFLLAAGKHGTVLAIDSALRKAERDGDGWRLQTAAGEHRAAILVNAAGAWADRVAAMAGVTPLGIQPYRRTMVQLAVDPAPADDMPLVLDISERFYFKPESGRLWLTPHDETPCDPGDVAPEEIDVAIAIDRLQGVVDWRVQRVEHRWAGLRSFLPDRLPAYGYDPTAADFFWYAGQGGFGIQTAPAAAKLAAALLLRRTPDAAVAGIDPATYSPDRFRR